MYVQNNLSSYIIFGASEDVLNSNRLFSMPSADDLNWSPLQISQDTLSSSLSRLSTFNFSSVNTASAALTAASSVGSYLSDAKSIIEELQSIAEQASSSSLSSEDRSQLSDDSAALLDRLDSIYNEASYSNAFIMRGGTTSFAVGPDGAEVSLSYGNLGRAYLGISTIDLSSAESSETAYDAITAALDNVGSQIDLNTAENQSIRSYMGMTSDEGETPTRADILDTVFQNSISAINASMTYALNIQAYDLRTNSLNTMISSFQNLSKSISYDDKVEEEESAAEQSSSSESSSSTTSTTSTSSADSTTTSSSGSTSTSSSK